MSVLSFQSRQFHLPRARYWPAIGAALAALFFLPAWSQAAVQVARGAAHVQIQAPMAMSFGAGHLYLALALGMIASALVGAVVGSVAAAVATLPVRGH